MTSDPIPHPDVAPGYHVITMNATDPDSQSSLVYTLPTSTIKAFDKNSATVTTDIDVYSQTHCTYT